MLVNTTLRVTAHPNEAAVARGASEVISTRSPTLASMGSVAGNALPLIRKWPPVSESS